MQSQPLRRNFRSCLKPCLRKGPTFNPASHLLWENRDQFSFFSGRERSFLLTKGQVGFSNTSNFVAFSLDPSFVAFPFHLSLHKQHRPCSPHGFIQIDVVAGTSPQVTSGGWDMTNHGHNRKRGLCGKAISRKRNQSCA